MSIISLRRASLAAASIVALQAAIPSHATAHEQATFKITIANVADGMTLKLPGGGATGAPIAPGAYAIVRDGAMIFEAGQPAGGDGLEGLAEDGNAEPFIEHLTAMPGVIEAGLFVPGQSFEVTVRPGERLAFAAMFVQSNDTFVATDPQGFALFDQNKRPLAGEVTDAIHYWDAGTEIDETPGVGPNQAPRQASPNSGPAENGNVDMQNNEFTYPAIAAVVQASIVPQ